MGAQSGTDDRVYILYWDWHECADWCWDCGDDFVVYEDADHSGWYLVYKVHTGV